MIKKIIIGLMLSLVILASCTEKTVDLQETESLPVNEGEEPAEEAVIPEGCTSWFDGCNNCMVTDGEAAACTRKYCEVMEEPECLAFEDEQIQKEGEEIRACCMAMTASCLACSEGIGVEEYCLENPETVGCE